MANLTELDQFDDGVFRIETDTVWVGGEDGFANKQGKALANRTRYLYNLCQALGTGKQPLDAMLTALAALATEPDQTLYFTGADQPSLTPLTAFMRTVLGAADAAAARGLLDAVSSGELAAAVAALVNAAPGALDQLNELAAAIGNDANYAATVANALALKAPLASPAFTGTPTAPTAAPGTNTDQIATMAALQAAINLMQTVPAGSVIYVAKNTAPTGYLKANGATVSRTTYAALFAAIGTTFGAGDGATTFNLPDLRGEFIRAWDDGRGVDSGRAFGSAQADSLKSHLHDTLSIGYGSGGSISSWPFTTSGSAYSGSNTPTSATGGTETRPRNVAMLACIKY